MALKHEITEITQNLTDLLSKTGKLGSDSSTEPTQLSFHVFRPSSYYHIVHVKSVYIMEIPNWLAALCVPSDKTTKPVFFLEALETRL